MGWWLLSNTTEANALLSYFFIKERKECLCTKEFEVLKEKCRHRSSSSPSSNSVPVLPGSETVISGIESVSVEWRSVQCLSDILAMSPHYSGASVGRTLENDCKSIENCFVFSDIMCLYKVMKKQAKQNYSNSSCLLQTVSGNHLLCHYITKIFHSWLHLSFNPAGTTYIIPIQWYILSYSPMPFQILLRCRNTPFHLSTLHVFCMYYLSPRDFFTQYWIPHAIFRME